MVKLKWVDKENYLLYRRDFTLLVNDKSKTFISSSKFNSWSEECVCIFIKHQISLLNKQQKLKDKKESYHFNKRAILSLILFPSGFLLLFKILGFL